MTELSHLDESGRAHMVDVGAKPETDRRAVAEGVITMSAAARDALFAGTLPKGDALAVTRVAAITGAKRTADLIPLCHPIPLTSITAEVEATPDGARVVVGVGMRGRTGVEMEAMTGVAIGLVTLYDMVKGIDRSAVVGPIRLLAKQGGSSGDWQR